MLLAEELALLTLTQGGRPAGGATCRLAHVAGITGALLIELEQQGAASFEGGQVAVLDRRPADGLLADTLDQLRPGVTVHGELVRLGGERRAAVISALVDGGVLARHRTLLRGYRFPVLDRPRQQGLIRELQDAAAGELGLDDRRTALLALAGPSQLLRVLAPTRRNRGAVNDQLRSAAWGLPVVAAVRTAGGATQSGWGPIIRDLPA